MTLSQRIGVVEINTLWLFRYLQLAKKRTKVVSFHRLSGTGMTSLIHLSPLLKCLMTVCPSSLHSCVQGTNFSPSEPPGEIMSFGVSPVNYSDSDSDRVSSIPGRFAKDRVNTQNIHANLLLVDNICTNGAVGTKNGANCLIRGTGA